MEYTPDQAQRLAQDEKLSSSIENITAPTIIRRLQITAIKKQGDMMFFTVTKSRLPLAIATNAVMTFGTESVTAYEYVRRVLERGDMIDAVVSPRTEDGCFPISMFWIHIRYVGTPLAVGSYSKKDDGLFAMRTKAGEKGERIVTKTLRDQFGHKFPDSLCESPGYFMIYYEHKKQRKPDRRCLACGLTFEIKKRNRDSHLRVSHSNGRPFISENALNGWHAFVFPDMKPRFVPNAAIAEAIAHGKFIAGEDRYDKWADVDSLVPCDPPYCVC